MQVKSTGKGEFAFISEGAEMTCYYYGDVMSEGLPDGFNKEAYISWIERTGEKGEGARLINYAISFFQFLGADIITLRVENGLGFGKQGNSLQEYYKKLGFIDQGEGKMYHPCK